MRIRSAAIKGAVAMALAMPVIGLSAPVAHADVNCDGGEICFWENHYYSGNDVYTTAGYEDNWPNYIENKESSLVNRGTSGLGVRVYNYHGMSGYLYCAPRGIQWGDLNPENVGSSHNWHLC
ncbi:hypothetical protein E1200_25330 [Actinomadura sp. GC306]|uniref:peptidase inhibitor family I36 protein n=1 Tax=Actinomadura sp. GC306 TaxID=2530367 RepID=UPI0010538CF0|nr:peptidase inhibitor family I36 protein [Actinomadura sp. GC306]TDC62560.1 hypothetical protein E1200_25330 [Actinomadura sp. GC306]